MSSLVTLHNTTAAILSLLLATPPLPAAAAASPARAAALTPEQRALHALNRLTFGPRPGDLQQVERIGLKRWFEQQLNPASIDDSALDARLASFPAMSLPQAELIRRFPSPQMLRALAQRNDPLPTDPVEHAIYVNGIALAKQVNEKKSATEPTANTIPPSIMEAPPSGAPQPSPAVVIPKRGPRVDLLAGDPGSEPLKRNAKGKTAPANADMAGTAQPNARPAGHLVHDDSIFPASDTDQILALAPAERVSRILALSPSDLVRFRRSLSQSELVALVRDLTPQQKEILAALGGSERVVATELLESRLVRDVYSSRQLEAVMTDFWLNHFNVYLRKNGNEPYLLPAYERETIRPHALGRFEDLLVATAQSPAMLMYLDNWQSIGPDSLASTRGKRLASYAKNPTIKQRITDRGLNENYARELMELHTLGVRCEVSKDHGTRNLDKSCGTGYTQADVTAVANVFTGWTIDRPYQGATYSFEARRHQPGDKSVLGRTIRDSGEREGLEVLHLLATSPATARFISTKLAIRFVSDTPPPALVDRMSKCFLKTGGDIRSVLRTMFNSPEFWSPEVYRAKVKTPLEFVTSALRATGADTSNPGAVVLALDRLGMPLYGMQTPNGYSWLAEPWISSSALVTRLNFALVLSADRLPGTHIGLWALLVHAPTSSAAVASVSLSSPQPVARPSEQQLEAALLSVPASDRTREAVLTHSTDASASQQAERDLALHPSGISSEHRAASGSTAALDRETATRAGLLLGSPEFQRR